MTALVLAGHGSHITPETAGLVWRLVDALRSMGVADEVTAAFWKEQPSFSTALSSLTSTDITVVPLFTAQGYFTQTVIPAEMKLDGPITRRDGRIIRYARTLNEHPYLAEVVRCRVEDALRQLGSAPEQTAVVIIGHSTRRNPESRRATEAQAAQIRSLGLVAQVEAVYLDDSPEIAESYALTDAPNLIAVPYFLAAGSHTTIDVPRELGLAPLDGVQKINGRSVLYMSPVGMDDALQNVILELAREAGAPLKEISPGSPWDCFPSAGFAVLADVLAKTEVLRFGDLNVTASEVCVRGDRPAAEIMTSPADLRTHIRENLFRSLTTGKDLPGGWHVPLQNLHMLYAVIETIYPGAPADWAANQHSTFQPNTFQITIERQTGNYRTLADMTPVKQAEIVASICANCVRQPTWFHGTSPADTIPCAEPCNHWLSAALDHHT